MNRGALLQLKREPERITSTSIKALVDLRVDLERKMVAGPWDDWDGVALEQCLTVVNRRLMEAYAALDEALPQEVR